MSLVFVEAVLRSSFAQVLAVYSLLDAQRAGLRVRQGSRGRTRLKITSGETLKRDHSLRDTRLSYVYANTFSVRIVY